MGADALCASSLGAGSTGTEPLELCASTHMVAGGEDRQRLLQGRQQL